MVLPQTSSNDNFSPCKPLSLIHSTPLPVPLLKSHKINLSYIISLCRDQSIPSLEDIETDVTRSDHQKLEHLIDEQMEYEKFVCETAREEVERGGFPNARTECKPPHPCQEFSSARLILSHMRYLSLESLKVGSCQGYKLCLSSKQRGPSSLRQLI